MTRFQATVIIFQFAILTTLLIFFFTQQRAVTVEPEFWCYLDSHKLGGGHVTLICRPGTLMN